MSTELTVGRSRVRLIREVGRGATSKVWEAEDSATTGRLAVKVALDGTHAARLADEAQRLLFVESPTLAGLVGAGIADVPVTDASGAEAIPAGATWIALDWAEGRPLDVHADRKQADRVALALSVARDIGRALADLHALGAAHGDVKPANIMVVRTPRPSKRDVKWRATLVDLGLATIASDRTVRGGTVRYLAPEVWQGEARGDARARDLWALGVTLAEIVDSRVAATERPSEAFDADRMPAELNQPVRALLAPAAAARPDAHWVWRTALARLGDVEDVAAMRQRRQIAIRRAYLSVRERELREAASALDARIRVDGAPAIWLADALERVRGVGRVLGRGSGGAATYTFEDLDPAAKKQWLIRFVGVPALEWPAPAGSDSELCERLCALVESREPTSLSFGELERGAAAEGQTPNSDDPIGLALALSRAPVTPSVLDAAEAFVSGARGTERLALLLAQRLRLAGQLGRALAVLGGIDGGAAKVQMAEVARRAGAPERAEQLLGEVDRTACSGDDWARRSATLGRIALDRGDAPRALELCGGEATSVAVLETRALAQIASADHAAAASTVERGRLLCCDDEERARIEAVAGVLAGARGDAHNELECFVRASQFAARAGAVLEEATYLTGLAAAATQVGDFARALSAAQRAILLFQHLGRPAHAARAAQAQTALYVHVGAVEQARAAAELALGLARAGGDRRCRAYVHINLADVLPLGDREGADHAERAAQLLGTDDPDDRLRVAARQIVRGVDVELGPLDALGRDPVRALDARLDWWGSRARVLASRRDGDRGDAVVAELVALAGVRAAAAVRGPALAAGAELAAAIGDGDAARRLTLAAGDAARELLSRVGEELSVAVENLDWVRRAQVPQGSVVAPEQLTDIEALVRALGRRDRLRPLLDRVLDALVLWTGVERGLLLLRAPGGRLVARAARNLAHADLTGAQLALSHSLAERALAQREPVVAVDAAGDLPEIHQSVHALKLRSVLAVPLIAQGETLGVVYLDDRVRRGAFGPPELAWVRIVAALAAVAIADARDQLLLRRAARRAERAESRLAGELARREAELDQARGELARAREGRQTRFAYDAIVGQSTPIREMLRVIDRVTISEVPVLIFGESGSGKELVARAIHHNGPRSHQPFVTENCSAIPEGLLESTLFGHVRGAFTGASRPRAGLFEIADGGTLFLDEIAEMSLGMQSKLLRVLEDGVLRPVGSDSERRVDVRVIGATHRSMDELVESGRFRRDLFYRLNVISVRVPPLRERPADIALLVRHFIELHAKARNVTVSKGAMELLTGYAWPGNVRQLENEVRRALVLADSVIEVSHLSPEVRERTSTESRQLGLNVRQRVDALEIELVQTALGRTGGNQTRAAELLGLSRFGLQKMLRRLGIEIAPSVSPMTSVSR